MKNTVLKILCAILMSGIVFISAAGLKAQAAVPSDVWAGTFQLTWNDLMDKIVHGKVEFVGGNPWLANELNKRSFDKSMLSEDSYYTICAKKDKKLKKKIEKDIWQKFHEKSDILDKFEWGRHSNDAFFIYAMLVKNFEFPIPFDIFKPEKFEDSEQTYKYFGIDRNSHYKMAENVKILFFEDENEYAITLKDKKNEEVILYRSDNLDGSFDDLFKTISKKSEKADEKLMEEDTLKVPFINVDKEISYDELINKEIKNTDRLFIAKALQTIKFNMDNKGGKLKSEAAMDIMKMSMPIREARHYNFNKKFVLFMKESNKEKPYFALKVLNGDYLVK